MKTGIHVTGFEGFNRQLDGFARALNREMPSLLRQEARALCVSMASQTGPGLGLSENNAIRKRNSINADVRRIFASRQSAGRVYQLLKDKRPDLAAGYWNAYKSQNTRRMGRILTTAGFSEAEVNVGTLKTQRTGPHGSVPKDAHAVALGREPVVNALSRRQQLLVGVAKAGWYQAARGLGGRIRRNLRDASGDNRSTEEIFPEYVRKVSRKFSGLGGAVVTEGTRCTVTVFTNVRYAVDALVTPDALDQAITRAEASFRKALEAALSETNRTTFSRAA